MRLGFTRFAYDLVGFWVFSVLKSFPVRVYLRVSYCFFRIEVFFKFRVILRLGLIRFAYGFVG